MISAQKMLNNLLIGLTPKQRVVVFGRFGLDGLKNGRTLADIGKELELTRERIRQIENSAVGFVRKKIDKDKQILQLLLKISHELESVGGLMKKADMLKKLSGQIGDVKENHLDFLAETSSKFYVRQEDEEFQPFYYLNKTDLHKAGDFIGEWVNYLHDNKPKILAGSYNEHLKNFIKLKRVDYIIAQNYLSLSKLIHKNIYGDVGPTVWPEIKPATTRDRAYAVLKKKNKPLHFEELTKEINDAGFSPQLALAPTVHNELIKDERFVLVGRGIYGLREFGYEPGIAREVIKKILKKHGPLHPKDVISYVSKERFLQPNTIIVNLQNKDHFERLTDGKYRAREA